MNFTQQCVFYPHISSVYQFRKRATRARTVLKGTTSRRYSAPNHTKNNVEAKGRRKQLFKKCVLQGIICFTSSFFFFLQHLERDQTCSDTSQKKIQAHSELFIVS